MKPKCSICNKKFEKPGGLLFEPPDSVQRNVKV